MDSFSLPSYSKAAGNTQASVVLPKPSVPTPSPPPAKTDDLESDDEVPFFDTELNLPEESSGDDTDESEDDDDNKNENKELNFTTTSSEDSDIPLEPKPQLALSLLKSATRLSLSKPDNQKANSPAPEPNASPTHCKFSAKYNPKEVSIVSIFNSAVVSNASEEKTSSNSTEFIQKNLIKIKPLYVRLVRVLKNKAEEPVEKTGEKIQKHTLSARLRLVCKRLGKCNSSSSAVATVSSPQRRDDSLLMQQDGIQSAIAHCKRSFKEVSKGTGSSL